MADVATVLKTDEEVTFSDSGKLVEKIRITFKVGVHGQFIKRFDKETFDPFAAKREIDSFAQSLAMLHG